MVAISKRPQKFLALAIAMLALSIGGLACGGGDDGDEPASLSKAQYVKQADEICGKTEGRQRKLITEFQQENKNAGSGQKGLEEMISFAALPPMEQQIQELSALPQPDKEAATAKAYLEALEKGLEAAEQQPSTLLAQPGAFTKAEEAASDFGFKTCKGA